MTEIRQGYTRVTEILSPFSGLGAIDPAVLSNAAERGTKVHKICESIMRGLGEWEVDDVTRGYVHSFHGWWNPERKMHSIEERFYDDALKITGQIDMIEETPEGLIIIDIKTPAKPGKTWPLQGAAYAYLARKNGLEIAGVQFLQLNRHGLLHQIHIYPDNLELFMKCYDVYQAFFRR